MAGRHGAPGNAQHLNFRRKYQHPFATGASHLSFTAIAFQEKRAQNSIASPIERTNIEP